MTKAKPANWPQRFGHSSFGIPSSFVIRISSLSGAMIQMRNAECEIKQPTTDDGPLSTDNRPRTMNDLRFTFRQLLEHPAVKGVAAIAIALGCGRLVAIAEGVNPPFSIQQQGDTAWLVRPNGERFFSLGVCCV